MIINKSKNTKKDMDSGQFENLTRQQLRELEENEKTRGKKIL